MPSSHLILYRPLLLLPPIPPSVRVFSNESTLSIRWSKYWSFSFSISPSNEHPGLYGPMNTQNTFRMDWLDLLAVQGTRESSPTPQFKSINSLALSFLHSPTLTSIHDYWENMFITLKRNPALMSSHCTFHSRLPCLGNYCCTFCFFEFVYFGQFMMSGIL